MRRAVLALPLVLIAAAGPALAAPAPTVLAAAMASYVAGRFVEARHGFKTLTDNNSAIAETMLGTMYAKGQGVRRDPAIAAGYWFRAAHRGYAPAQLAFARILVRGDGIPADRSAAWLWLRLAEQRGDARTVAAARAAEAALAASGPTPPAEAVAEWRPWPGAGD